MTISTKEIKRVKSSERSISSTNCEIIFMNEKFWIIKIEWNSEGMEYLDFVWNFRFRYISSTATNSIELLHQKPISDLWEGDIEMINLKCHYSNIHFLSTDALSEIWVMFSPNDVNQFIEQQKLNSEDMDQQETS